jgi:Arylsulfotransferase (ASST)
MIVRLPTAAPVALAAMICSAALALGCAGKDATDASAPGPGPGPRMVGGSLGDGSVLNISVSPLTLTPIFSPSIHDYSVRCATGQNAIAIAVTDRRGTQSTSVMVAPDDAIEVRGQYWIRCLPPDFPAITVIRNPSGGGPTPGWYLVNGAAYGIVLDTNGTPVWYSRGPYVIDVDSLAPNTISMMPNATAPFGTDPTTRFDLHGLGGATTTPLTAVGSPTDAHELRLLPNGDYLLWTYVLVSHVDLTGLQTFGSDETVADCEIQEIDPAGRLVWSWLSTDHVDPVQESMEPAADAVHGVSVVDVFHFNSIDVDASGNLLLSARHANAIYYVDRTTGKIAYKLGGSPYSKDGAALIQIADDPQTAFNMQHDARFLPNGDITLFDDHGATPGVARGVEYGIDHVTNTATVAFQYLGVGQSQYEGSFRRYPDGHSVIGWGYIPSDERVLTEIDESGQDVLDVTFEGQVSYRAIKVPLSQLDIGMLRASTAK